MNSDRLYEAVRGLADEINGYYEMSSSAYSNSDEFKHWQREVQMASIQITTTATTAALTGKYLNEAYQHLAQLGQAEMQRRPDMLYYSNNNLGMWDQVRIFEPVNESHNKYKSRKLKEYSTPEFHKIKDILPKHMVPHAVMCPKEDIKSRINAYLTN